MERKEDINSGIGNLKPIGVESKYIILFNDLFNLISKNPLITVENISKILLNKNYNQEIINESIRFFLSEKILIIAEDSMKFRNIKLKSGRKPSFYLIDDSKENSPKIVLNLPPFNNFGIKTGLNEAGIKYFDQKDEIGLLFETAYDSIKICSPFLEFNGIKEYIPLLISKSKNGVEIKIISRQIDKKDPQTRYWEIKQLFDIFKKEKLNLKIRNYHYFTKRVESSTHAKLIICDNKQAYIGSGELRKNSFEKNFEVGVIVEGKKASELGLIFEELFLVSRDVNFE